MTRGGVPATQPAGPDHGAATPPAARRFFLVGALRSGTTLMRLLLEHHPQIAGCKECEFVLPALAGRADWPSTEEFVERLRRGVDPDGRWCFDRYDLPRDLDFPALADWLLCRLADADGQRLVGAAVHHHADQLPRLWPQAHYIHLLRDPRDVARSCVPMGWAGNAWGAVPLWQASYRECARLKSIVDPARWVEVRFEDLLRDPEHELGRVADFLGLAFDPQMLDIERDTTYHRPGMAALKTWRTEASSGELRAIEGRLGRDLTDAGYEPSSAERRPVGRLREAWLRLDDRWGRVRFAQRRYGLPVWLMTVLSRRVPLEPLREYVLRRRRATDVQYLQ